MWMPVERGSGGGGFDQGQQMARLDDGAFGESGGLGDDAFQLAEIVGPEALLELGQCGFIEQLGTLAGIGCDPVQQPLDEQGNVFDTLAQRRDKDFDGGETGVEVLAELPYGGEDAQVAIGGGDNPGVDAERPGAVEVAGAGLRREVAALLADADEA